MSVSQEVIERIRDRASAIEIISEYTTLRKTGKQYVGLCPFHQEKTPSFSVSEEEGLFYCFGCGKKGSLFDFVMEKRGLNFIEMLRFLGGRYGIEVVDEGVGSAEEIAKRKAQKELRSKLINCLELVVGSYASMLQSDPGASIAREYLKKRGIGAEAISKFQIGYAPEQWSFIERHVLCQLEAGQTKTIADNGVATRANFSREELSTLLKTIGVIGQTKDGRSYDIFRGRVIFPIRRSDGVPIALGGRLLSADAVGPKYLNSRESEIYSKRRTFYGMDIAFKQIPSQKNIYIVEGYLDVISMVQAGICNVVATCGTALTADHFSVLRRIVDRAVVVFDGDAAGMRASSSVFASALNSGVEVAIASLPDGHDPDSLVRDCGAEALKSALCCQKSALEAYMDHLMSQYDVKSFSGEGEDPEGNSLGKVVQPAVLAKVSAKIAQLLGQVRNPVERDLLSGLAAEKIGVTRLALDQLIKSKKVVGVSGPYLSARRQESSGGSSESGTSYNASNEGQSAPATNGNFRSNYVSRSTSYLSRTKVVESQRFKAHNEELTVVPPQTNVAGKRYLSRYEVAVLCALLRKPFLAGEIAKSPELVVLREALPKNVWSLVMKLDEGDYVGLDDCRPSDIATLLSADTRLPRSTEILRLVELLKMCFLPFRFLLTECASQIRVGGTSPERDLKEVVKMILRKKLREEMKSMSAYGATEDAENEENALKKAQEKLLKRKSLEGLDR